MEPMTRSLLSIPSIVWLFIMSAWPFTETEDVCRRSSGRLPLARPLFRPSVAPGVTCTKLMKLRPFSGSSCVAFSVTVVIKAAESVRSAGVAASTLTVSPSEPTVRCASSRARSPAERPNEDIWKALKPCAVAESEYVLGLSSVKVNSPPEPDLAVRVSCVLTSVKTITAFGIAAPVESVTVPTTSAVVFCASSDVFAMAAKTPPKARLRREFLSNVESAVPESVSEESRGLQFFKLCSKIHLANGYSACPTLFRALVRRSPLQKCSTYCFRAPLEHRSVLGQRTPTRSGRRSR